MKKNFVKWIKAAGVRAVKTVAQTAVAMIPVGISINEVGWGAVIGTS
ncbi:MAG: holin, partial [Acutalibacteraceae bacterium]|nr:holin [Acutalibacteraceae bacterium]